MMLKFLVLAAASFCSNVLAQGAPQINFIPSNITAGSTNTLSWSGGDSTPVSLTLMAGPPSNLLQAGIIAQNVQGTSYAWTTDKTIFNGDNYAVMIAQGTQFSISPYFAISGGAIPPTNTTDTSSNSTSSSAPTATASPTDQPHRNSTAAAHGTANNRPGSKLLDKSGIVGIVIGVVAIIAALATLGIFAIASKKLGKKGAGNAPEEPETAGIAPLTQRSPSDDHSRSPTPQAHYFPRKAVGSEEALSLRPDGSSTASPMRYRSALDSPSTLVPMHAKKMGDDGSSVATSRVPSIQSGPTSPDGQWEERAGYPAPSVATYAYNPNRPVSSMHPGTLVPQYTGDTMVGGGQNGANQAGNRGTMMSGFVSPEASPMRAQFGEVAQPSENSRGVRERRPSQSAVVTQSKLRQEVE